VTRSAIDTEGQARRSSAAETASIQSRPERMARARSTRRFYARCSLAGMDFGCSRQAAFAVSCSAIRTTGCLDIRGPIRITDPKAAALSPLP
jgi:hypothetical protein